MMAAIHYLDISGLAEEVRNFSSSGDRSILGICLGMQLLASTGFEGGRVDGLDIIPGVVKALPPSNSDDSIKVPRIGWLPVRPHPESEPLFSSVSPRTQPLRKYYFAHGFHFIPKDPTVITAVVAEDPVSVVAAVQCGNVYGTQFHPEKSGRVGLSLLHRFVTGVDMLEGAT